MSRQKPSFLFACLLLLFSFSPDSQAEDNLLEDAAFSQYDEGKAPGSPWKVKMGGEEAQIVRQSPPLDEVSQDWVHFIDRDQDVKVYMRAPIPEVKKGTLDFKLHFPEGTGTLFVYLVGETSELDNDNVVEFKVLESSGNVYIGAHRNRNLIPFKSDSSPILDVSIEFEATSAGEAIAVYLQENGQRNLVHRETFPGGGAVKEIAVGTDSITAQTEAYLGDLTLTPR